MQAIIDFFQNETVIQAIGFLGMGFSLIAMQSKSYNLLIFLRISSEFTFGFQYLLAGAWTGMATNFASVGTNSVYRYRIKNGKSTLPFQIAFAFLYTALCLISWHGWVSLLIIGAKVISTIAMGIKNTRTIRLLSLCSYPLWLIYNLSVGLIAAIINDCITIFCLLLAILRIDVIPAIRARRAAASGTTDVKE